MSPKQSRTGASYTVTIPANIDREDRLVAGLTARQLAILAVAALGAWVLVALVRAVLPLPVALGLGWAVLAVGLALALGRRDGLSLDRLLLAAIGQHRAPRRMVMAPEGVPAPPTWLPTGLGGPPPTPLELPVGGLDDDGVLDLGRDGAALVCRASSLTFSLRTQAEQAALVAAFARWLHALAGPVQLLVRAVPVDLAGMIAAIEQAAGGLPHPALEQAAREHARFLGELAARGDVRHREILVVFREPTQGPAAAELLGRRAEQAAPLLAAAGITLRRLDGAQTLAALAPSTRPGRHSPPAEGLAMPGEIITAQHARGGAQ